VIVCCKWSSGTPFTSQKDEFVRGGVGWGGGGVLGKIQILRDGPADYFCTPPGSAAITAHARTRP
jgi:hypothetical protein